MASRFPRNGNTRVTVPRAWLPRRLLQTLRPQSGARRESLHRYTRSSMKSATFSARTRVFAAGWALASLYDKLWWKHWSGAPSNFAVVAAALLLIARPGSATVLLAFAAAQVVDWFSEPTVMGGHFVLLAFANASILVTGAWMLATGRLRGDGGPSVLQAAAPALRAELVVVYLLAALHKLNADFLDPESSCVTMLLRDPVQQALPLKFLPSAPDGILVPAIHGTLLVEATIPFLLWMRRARAAGAALALLFHSFISSGPRNGFSAFAIVVFPLLVLFMSEDCAARLVGTARGLQRWLSAGPTGRLGPVLALLGLLLLSASAHKLGMVRLFPFWITLDLLVLAFFAGEVIHHRGDIGDPSPGFFDVESTVLAVMPILLLVNGLSPYLGLKTETSFAMISNLRTEGAHPNSLVVPGETKLFGLQDDLVEVKETSVPELLPYVGKGLRLPFFHLRSLLTPHPAASLVFVRDGREIRIDRVDRHRDLLPPVPAWQRRLMPFRAVEADGPQRCRH